MIRRFLTTTAILTGMTGSALAADRAAVLDTYADIAAAGYADSQATAETLRAAVADLIAAPSEATLSAARAAWLAARVPYQQTEAFRFGNPLVDDWEGKVNAWPLDEGLIDYVDADYPAAEGENMLAALNVIANPRPVIAGVEVDASRITPELIADTLDMADGMETNVARGYHAIEFLLWGQDLNGTGPGAGARPYTDFVTGPGCTGGHCDRRADYLRAATDLLVADLAEMAALWAPGGAARAAVTEDEAAGISAILTGMGSLSYGELAGERMKLGLLLNDPEEEHDCFSDNTHNSHYYDGLGIRNVYLGRYVRPDGSVIEGPSVSDLVAETAPEVDAEMRARLDTTVTALDALRTAAEGGMAYDMMLARGNDTGEVLIQTAVDGLVAQTRSIERVVAALDLGGISIEGSDSLDDPAAAVAQ
ncbi:imelysin family protein [Phaeovulum vinaykumarii]|uniref:Imelysin. Metallo peptidase. MEROPS family M75 n=1 Tax=Phaeovulum vinaykumarii TaxID=407234 RepID=A0A1N7L0L2_9RHOB|nr:imelysin family protein [Phaeovulum vinaykumarii]SIS67368.1 imelysin. Metallo peptidase. MEROPS family M75 [Phaeovulum vinaykumarii]SOC00739.1 imelysin [Phaeovulum vinaykumarii]